jgi:hypothetical protein
MTDPLHDQLAAIVRTHAKCGCEQRAFWPWRRDVECNRCLALTAYELRKAAELAKKERDINPSHNQS